MKLFSKFCFYRISMDFNMYSLKTLTYFCLTCLLATLLTQTAEAYEQNMNGDVLIAIFVRNKAHTLPYFLNYLQNIDYTKDLVSLWIRTDHNIDNSSAIVERWLAEVKHMYHNVDYKSSQEDQGFADEQSECDWSPSRFQNIIDLRQEALDEARRHKVNYLLFLDADNFLLNPATLHRLIEQKRDIVAPMLNFTAASAFYSNFWYGMDSRGYYQRTPDYMPTLHRHRQGCFSVPLVHSTILIDLHSDHTQQLSYSHPYDGYDGPVDDIIMLALSAKHHKAGVYILNDDFFGYGMVPLEAENNLSQDVAQFVHLKLENIVYKDPLEKIAYLPSYVPKTKLGFDQIYLINLERRPDRRSKMLQSFDELGIEAKIMPAVDGKLLNESVLKEMDVKIMDNYEDPYWKRTMKMGEIGCFMSHYYIWKDVVENSYASVLLFEDDIHFKIYFREKLDLMMAELENLGVQWDLVYLGRKHMGKKTETYLTGTQRLTWPGYSYWTLSYALSYSGALKLLEQNPVQNMIPVDEYIPVMYDEHPNEDWKSEFSPRDLVALSSYPLLVTPTHYTGEPGYLTDTEDSVIIDESAEVLRANPRGDDNVMIDIGSAHIPDEL